MRERNTKVSYNISKNTKDKLDQVKKDYNKNLSELVDSIMSFEKEGIETFIDMINLIHNSDKKYSFYYTKNGAIVLNESTAEKIRELDIGKMDKQDVAYDKYAKEFEKKVDSCYTGNELIDKKLKDYGETEKKMKMTFVLMDKRMNKMEKALKANGIDPDKVEIDD